VLEKSEPRKWVGEPKHSSETIMSIINDEIGK